MTRLKYERQLRGLSQVRLAKDAKLNQPDLSMIERGILIPNTAQLERLSTVLGIAGGELLKEIVVIVTPIQAAS